jgi:hypothetical protein
MLLLTLTICATLSETSTATVTVPPLFKRSNYHLCPGIPKELSKCRQLKGTPADVKFDCGNDIPSYSTRTTPEVLKTSGWAGSCDAVATPGACIGKAQADVAACCPK